MVSSLLSPLAEVKRGVASYPKALGWLRKHPKQWFLLLLPGLFGFLIFVGLCYLLFTDKLPLSLFSYQASEVASGFGARVLQFFLAGFFKVLGVLMALVFALLLSSILSAPIYEWVSLAVEKDVTGLSPRELSLWESIKLIGEEIKKMVFIILVSTALFFIPFVNIFALFATAWLLGWNFYDYPMARAGRPFTNRLKAVGADAWAVLGLGLWLMIPFVQIFLAPPAIVAGTLLYCETCKLSRKGDAA